MQMQELESTAQETPGPAASQGPQPLSCAAGAGEAQRLRVRTAWHCKRGAQPHAAAGKPWKWKLLGEGKKKPNKPTPGEQAVPHHVRTKNKPAFFPGFGP